MGDAVTAKPTSSLPGVRPRQSSNHCRSWWQEAETYVRWHTGFDAALRGGMPRMTRIRVTLAREEIADRLAAVGYIADRDIATALWLMEFLKRPLLLEGEAGVGKTEVAKALAAVHGAELIRLQCYEGLDQNAALYEWNYQRQLLAIKAREGAGENADAIEEHIFSEKLSARAAAARRDPARDAAGAADRRGRPRRRGVRGVSARAPVRLPGEHSRARHDQGDASIPRVVLTSNGTRELSDALRRRCLYHYVDFPDVDREARIILARLPGIDAALAAADRPHGRGGAQGGPAQGAGRRRDARLGGDARRPRACTTCGRSRRPSRDDDLPAQDARGPRPRHPRGERSGCSARWRDEC